MSHNRRNALRVFSVGAVGAMFSPVLTACAEDPNARYVSPVVPIREGKYSLPDLPYTYDALEPAIDTRTMEIHHARHHQAYVNNLNEALEQHPELQERTLEELLQNLDDVPSDVRIKVRNNGGGHWNHSVFWTMMSPDGGGAPADDLGDAITSAFGSFDAFQSEFKEAATGVFGSGWAWLVAGNGGRLTIEQTPNQDTPVMEGRYPVLGIDVWEHAYYLQYQNRRGDYIDRFWDVVDWQTCNERFQNAPR